MASAPAQNNTYIFHTDPTTGKVFYRKSTGDGSWLELPPGEATQASTRLFQPPGGPSGPIQHELRDYNVSVRPVAGPSNPVPIDPALLPLPGSNDHDLTDLSTLARANGLKPAEKVAGRRQKARALSKGKKRARSVSSSDSEDNESSASEVATAKGRGRPVGAGNYAKPDVNKILDITQKVKPTGPKGWRLVAKKYNKWALKNGRPQRELKAVENKYKSLLRTKKPTGDAECPPEIKRVHQIEQLINEKVGTRGLSDESQSDNDDIFSDVQIVEPVRTAVARRAATPPLRSRRTTGADLITTFNRAFDPTTQQAREDARSQRSFETAQLLAATQQLDVLRTENSALKDKINDLKRTVDRAEFQLQLARVTGSFDKERGSRHPYHPWHDTGRDYSQLQRKGGKIRCEERYPDGGAMTYWITDCSSDASDFDNRPTKMRRLSSRSPGDPFLPTSTPGPSRHVGPSHRRRSPTPGASSSTPNGVELAFTPNRGGDTVKFVVSPQM